MWTKTTLTVGVEQSDDVLLAVQAFFDANRRFGSWIWLEPGRSIGAGTVTDSKLHNVRHNPATGGERMKVDVRTLPPGRTELEVMSFSVPLYDWGRNRRNIQELVRQLQAAGLAVETGPMVSKHTLGGPK